MKPAMKTAPISLTVFFPTYNEEENIARAIRAALSELDRLVASREVGQCEVLIVNDGSTDRTKEIVLGLAQHEPRIRLVDHPMNLGHGAAIITGLRDGLYDYVFFTDADLQFDIAELGSLVAFVPEYEAVIGYRVERKDSPMRLINSRFWNLLSRHLLGLRVRDTNCAFKLFKKDLLANIEVQGGGAMTTIEILFWLQKKGVQIKEVPVTHYPRMSGKATGAKASTIWRAIREMMAFYVKTRRVEK